MYQRYSEKKNPLFPRGNNLANVFSFPFKKDVFLFAGTGGKSELIQMKVY